MIFKFSYLPHIVIQIKNIYICDASYQLLEILYRNCLTMILESRDTFFLSLSLRPTTNSWRPWTDTNKKKRNSSLYNSVLQKYKIYFDYFITICPHPLVTNLLLSISLPQSAFPDDSTEFSSATRKKQLSNKAR